MVRSNAGQARGVTALDVHIGVCVLVCLLVATALDALGLKFPVGDMRLEVIQPLTASISCILCSQDGVGESRSAGLSRLVVTAVGGVLGVAIVFVDNLLGGNAWLLAPLTAAGVVGTIVACRLVGVAAFTARIGAITLVLVACTLSGSARVYYAVFRLVSTLFGAGVSVLVAWGLPRLGARRSGVRAGR